MSALVLALALLGHPSVQPWPVGPGPRFRPPALSRVAATGRPLRGLVCARGGAVFQLHVEIFAGRRVVVLPAGIGVAEPSVRVNGVVVPHGCSYPVRTLTPAGIVEVRRAARLRLADLFAVWGQSLGPKRIASFRSSSAVRAYVDGKRFRGPVGEIPLTPHAQIVLELGAYVPPHPFFLFAGGPS